MNKHTHYHFIGIGGIGMSGLARLLLKGDNRVTGSDLAANYVVESLINEGASVKIGHSADHVAEGSTVVFTTGVDESNPEYAAAKKYHCPLMHRSDLLNQLMKGHQTLAVAGTHGKTTTSSLLAATLAYAGVDPTFAVGGIIRDFHSNARKGDGSYFVAEACESDGTFVKYNPYGAIITNIDFDHMDFFGSEEKLLMAFRQFIGRVSNPEHLLWCGDNLMLSSLEPPGISYGHGEKNSLRVINERQEGWSIVFDVTFEGKVYEGIRLPLVGHHNALNAGAVFGLCLTLGVPEDVIKEAFLKFQGVCRRCEKKGESHEILLIDDYAHHPTEIAATLQGIRKAVGERRVIAVFQPHRYTRTKDCMEGFAKAFDDADEVVITDIYAAGENPIGDVSALQVADVVKGRCRVNVCHVAKDNLIDHIAGLARPHDVIISLGAGDITKLCPELLRRWESTPPKKWRVGVVFGGKSSEHEVSLKSAKHVIDSLDMRLYDAELFGIKKTGEWVKCTPSCESLKKKCKETPLLSTDVLDALLDCDIFFPVLHGPYGEDGTLQGFFDTLGKAYVGCDHRSAALCMDKALTKKVASLLGIPVVPFLSFSEFEWREQRDLIGIRIFKELRYPVFVKPLHLGSTVGITKVGRPEDLEAAIEAAFRVDTELLVENGLQVRELEFAVMGNEEPRTFPPGEVLTGGRIYDYHGKYDDKDPIRAIPQASLNEGVVELGMAWALKAYKAAGCKGMARVDFFLDSEGQLWLNEINPIPGFTINSLYPQICAVNGMPGSALVDKLIIYALERKRLMQRSLENL